MAADLSAIAYFEQREKYKWERLNTRGRLNTGKTIEWKITLESVLIRLPEKGTKKRACSV